MSKRMVPAQLMSAGVKDARQDAFVETLDAVLSKIDVSRFNMSDAQTVDAKLLPALITEFSLNEFITQDMPEQILRDIIGRAYDLHAKKAYIEGARLGLSLLGLDVDWKQWWQQEPKGAHNTHLVTVEIDQVVFQDSEELLDERLIKAALKMIEATKRWSQDIVFRIAAATTAPVYVGHFPIMRMVIEALPYAFDPPIITTPMRVGMASTISLHITAQILET